MSDTETHRFNKLRRPLKELRRRRRGIGGRRWRPRPLLRVHAATRGHAAPRLQRRHQQHGLLHGQYGRPIFSFTGTIKETNASIGVVQVLLLCLFRRLWQLADRSTGRSTDVPTNWRTLGFTTKLHFQKLFFVSVKGLCLLSLTSSQIGVWKSNFPHL